MDAHRVAYTGEIPRPTPMASTWHSRNVSNKLWESYDPNGKFPYALAAYNDILAVPARNGGVVHLIGFMVLLWGPTAHSLPANPGQWTTGNGGSYWAGGGYMIRRSMSDYDAREIGGRRCSPDQADPVLTSVRAYALSPFPEQKAGAKRLQKGLRKASFPSTPTWDSSRPAFPGF